MIEWTESNQVFLPEIDEEHRVLFAMASDLDAAVEAGAAAKVPWILKELAAGIDAHFKTEERLMRAAKCPSYAWHKRQHDGVRARVAEFARRIEDGDGEGPRALLDYLAAWLRDHTAVTDRIMGAYLRANRRMGARNKTAPPAAARTAGVQRDSLR